MPTHMLLAAGQGQLSQSAAAAAAETEPEADNMPPIQNTLDSQPAEADPGSALASAPAGPALNTPQLPKQSLVDKLNDVAEEEPVMTKAVGTEDGSIAFVTEPGIAEGIQTSADAAAVTAGLEAAISPAGIQSSPGKAGVQSSAGKVAEKGPSAAATQLAKDTEESAAVEQAGRSPAKTRTSRAAKAAATVKAATTAVPESGGRRSSARFSVDKKKQSGASAAGSNSSGKENAIAAPAEEANHMAEKEPHSRVEEVTGSKGGTPSQAVSGDKKKKEASDKKDPWIGRRIKKDFETDSGLKTYTGWIIGRHEAKKW